jgi:ABC-type branched-subunit amino acid transport system ATPase component
MFLRELEITNFRSIRHVKLTFENNIGNIWAFIGRNDVGKTNIMNAIDLLFRWDKAQAILPFQGSRSINKSIITYNNGGRRIILNRLPGTVIIRGKVEFTPEEMKGIIGVMEYDVLEINHFFSTVSPIDNNISIDVELRIVVSERSYTLFPRLVKMGNQDLIWLHENGELMAIKPEISGLGLTRITEPTISSSGEIGNKILEALYSAVFTIQAERGIDGALQGSEIVSKIKHEKTTSGGLDRTFVEDLQDTLKSLGIEKGNLDVRTDDIAGKDEIYYGKIPASQVGSGVNSSLVLAGFLVDNNKSILLFEEPEIHLHPQAQKDLIKVLTETHPGKQIFITTHSPIIASSLRPESINLVVKRNETTEISPTEDGSVNKIVTELGIVPTDYGLFDAIVFGEGDTDKAIFEEFAHTLGIQIKIMFVGCQGVSTVADYANAQLASELKLKWGSDVFIIHDGDVFSQQKRKDSFNLMKKKLAIGEDHIIGLAEPSIDAYLLKPEILKRSFPLVDVSSDELEQEISKYSCNRNKKETVARLLTEKFGIRYDPDIARKIARSFKKDEIDKEFISIFERISEDISS